MVNDHTILEKKEAVDWYLHSLLSANIDLVALSPLRPQAKGAGDTIDDSIIFVFLYRANGTFLRPLSKIRPNNIAR